MATGLRSRRIRGNLAFYDTHRMRLVDAIGPDVKKWELEAAGLQIAGGTGTDPTAATTTVVEVGAGTSEMRGTNVSASVAECVTAANENDGINVQWFNEDFEFTSDQDLYFGVSLAADDVTQSDLFVGLAITDTTLLGGVSDAVYFECVDGGATVSSVTEKDSTETQTDSLATLANDTDAVLEFYFDGTSVYFFTNGTRSSTIHTANIPDDEALRVSLQWLAGAAAAKTLTINWMRCIQIGR